MNPEEFFDINTIREDYDLEVKDARGVDGKGKIPTSLWETYSAMSNTDGGYIVLGIGQKGNEFIFHGIPNVDRLMKELWDCLNNRKKVSVNLLSTQDVRVQEINGKKMLWVYVPRASRKQRPVYLNNNPLAETYRRNFEGDYRCSEDIVKQMLGEQANDTRDAFRLDGFGMNDVSLPTLQLYRQHFANRSPHHPFNDCDNLEFLRNLGGWVCDRQSGSEGLSLAGLLMFGKLRPILDAVPNYVVDYQERPRALTELRWVDRMTTDYTWSGNLYDFYQGVIKRLYDGLKVPFAMEADARVHDSPVHVALREALVNTLIHADYAGACSI
ncbi:MAG: AAA family ATPase, partial [Planctomycetaceae bacterium]